MAAVVKILSDGGDKARLEVASLEEAGAVFVHGQCADKNDTSFFFCIRNERYGVLSECDVLCSYCGNLGFSAC